MTKQERSWILYDVANSAYVLIVATIFFPIFFKDMVVPEGLKPCSTSLLGFANSIIALVLAICAPLFGTFSDYKDKKKLFWLIALFTGVIFNLFLVFVKTGEWKLCLAIYIIATIGYSAANVFYDAFLTDVTTDARMDRISSSGFAWGYFGSSIPCIFGIAIAKNPKLIFLAENDHMTAIKIIFAITALWWIIFSISMMFNVRQKYFVEPGTTPVKDAFIRIWHTLVEIRKYKAAFIFLLAFFFYIDGVHTIIYMAVAFGRDWKIPSEILPVIILVIQFVAFPFAILYGYLAKKVTTKGMLYVGLLTYTVIVFIAFFIPFLESIKMRVYFFWGLGILVGTAQGGVQALSRSLFGKIIPKEKSGEFFGFYNIFGKFAAILGPLIIGIIATSPEKTKWAVLSLLIFFIIGGGLLTRVKTSESGSVVS